MIFHFHFHHRMKCCCLGRIHHVCCLLRESPRLFHRHECLFLGGSGMKDVSAWQMLRRWDLKRTVIGQERGGQNTSKRGIENIERGFASFCAPTKRATEAFGSRDNTEYFLSGEATTLNTSWMEQNPRQEEYLCRDPNAVVLKLGGNNTLATKALAQMSNHLEIHRGSNVHVMCSQNSLKKWSWRSKSHS